MYNFQQTAHGPERDVEREKVAYDKLLAKYAALRLAADEGVFQITIYSDSGAITVPVSYFEGCGIATSLAEGFSKWIGHVEGSLNHSLEAVADKLREERKQQEERQQQRNTEAMAGRAQDAQRELAEAVAAVINSKKGGEAA